MKCFCVNIILLLHSCSLFLLPLVFWEKASLPCVDNDEDYNHGLIIWDGDPVGLSYSPGIELEDVVIYDAAVVVYDVTNPSSFYEAMTQVKYTQGVVVLVGSKADLLMDRKITYEVLSYYDFVHV